MFFRILLYLYSFLYLIVDEVLVIIDRIYLERLINLGLGGNGNIGERPSGITSFSIDSIILRKFNSSGIFM